MNENDALVAAIKAEQAARGLKQDDLARRVGVSVTSMQRYLAGERMIRSDLMWRIGDALEVTVSALWADAERRLRQAGGRVVDPNASSRAANLDAAASGDSAAQMAEQLSALRSLVESLGGEIHTKARVQKPAPTSLKGDGDDPQATGRPHAI